MKILSVMLLVCVGAVLLMPPPAFCVSGKMPITTSSDIAKASYLQGRELLEKLRYREAQQYFLKAVDLDPEFAIAYLQLARVQSSTKESFDSFSKARALLHKVSEAEQLWILGFEAGYYESKPLKQRELYERLVNMYPNDERSHNLLVGNYYAQQEWALVVRECELAIHINSEFSAVYNQMGYALMFLERYADAEKAFKKYVEYIPDDPNPHNSYAELLMKMGRFNESNEQYKAALALNPDFTFSHIGIASNFSYLGQHEKAREQLQLMYNGAKDDGQRRTALSTMAFSYIDEGKFDQALEQYQKRYAIAEAKGDTSAMAGDLALMGFALIEVEDREEEAISKFEQARTMVQASSLSEATKGQSEQAYFYRTCRAYVAMGNVEQAKVNALKYRTRALTSQHPTQIRGAHQLFGLIALKEGKFDLAIEELLQSNLQNAYNYFFLGKAYQSKGDLIHAKEYYRKAANFNSINNSQQASIRIKANQLASEM
ncbi:MAG: tetratricopeptide repeat protein [Candidatus Zixiibacteriota bacterium]